MLELLRTIVWSDHQAGGAEYASLWRDELGWQIRGTVITAIDCRPLRVRYGVICDEQWRTRAVHIALRAGGPEQALHLTVDDELRWFTREGEIEAARGCMDADLSITPSTNTLPIRRLRLEPGQSAAAVAAWVRFPDMTVEPLHQTYTCLDPTTYRYQSEGGFEATLEVDDLGVVMNYSPWERVAHTDDHLPR